MSKIYASRNIGVSEIQIVIGDIVEQPDMDAIVNSSNSKLFSGSGVSAAIFRAAGAQKLADACGEIAPIGVGDAVITSGFLLPNRFIVHCCGPQYNKDPNPEDKLASCYLNILTLAEEKQIASLAIPAISTGAYGFPIEESIGICINVIKESGPKLDSLKTIRFVVRDETTADIYARYLMEVIPRPDKAVRVALDAQFSQKQFQRIQKGFIGDQDYKWFMYFESPWLYIFRGGRWAGNCWWFLRFEPFDEGYKVAEAWADNEWEAGKNSQFLYWLIDDYLPIEGGNGRQYKSILGELGFYCTLRKNRVKLEMSSECCR